MPDGVVMLIRRNRSRQGKAYALPELIKATVHSRSKQGKAHRRKQGAGVVPYVKPLSRSNAVLRRLLDEHTVAEGEESILHIYRLFVSSHNKLFVGEGTD